VFVDGRFSRDTETAFGGERIELAGGTGYADERAARGFAKCDLRPSL
jgi:hypothetical protein